MDPIPIPVLTFTAGEKRPLPLSFRQPDGSALDLTGARVLLTVADSASAEEPDELLRLDRGEHDAPTTGDTSLLVDLTELPAAAYREGMRLQGDLWLIDAAGHRTSFGAFALQISPAVTRDFSEPT